MEILDLKIKEIACGKGEIERELERELEYNHNQQEGEQKLEIETRMTEPVNRCKK